MIATPEQYRTLADLIERMPVTAVLMLGDKLIVATGRNPDGPLTCITPDGCFAPVEFERPIR